MRWRAWPIVSAVITLTACGLSDPVDRFRFEDGAARPNSATIGAVVLHSTVELPEGFSRIPDGGSPRILYYSAKFYVIDAATATIRNSASFATDAAKELSGTVDGFRGDDSVYVTLWPCQPGNCFPTLRSYNVKHYLLVTGSGPFLIDTVPRALEVLPWMAACHQNPPNQCFHPLGDTLDVYDRASGTFQPLFMTRPDNEIARVR